MKNDEFVIVFLLQLLHVVLCYVCMLRNFLGLFYCSNRFYPLEVSILQMMFNLPQLLAITVNVEKEN